MIEERLARLEYLLIDLCRNHPEICPHDDEWLYSRCIDEENNIWEKHYKCDLCGREVFYQEKRR